MGYHLRRLFTSCLLGVTAKTPASSPFEFNVPSSSGDALEQYKSAASSASSLHHLHIFTDGSKSSYGAAGSAVCPARSIQGAVVVSNSQLRGFSTMVSTAELLGVQLALLIISKISKPPSKVTIFTDCQNLIYHLSGSTLPSAKAKWEVPDRNLVKIIQMMAWRVKDMHSGVTLRLQWIPGHAGIPGNEVADKLAKVWTSCPSEGSFLSFDNSGWRVAKLHPSLSLPFD